MAKQELVELDEVEIIDLGDLSTETFGSDRTSATEGPWSRQLD